MFVDGVLVYPKVVSASIGGLYMDNWQSPLLGVKRKSESSISSIFDVRFTPGSGRWADKMAKGR